MANLSVMIMDILLMTFLVTGACATVALMIKCFIEAWDD